MLSNYLLERLYSLTLFLPATYVLSVFFFKEKLFVNIIGKIWYLIFQCAFILLWVKLNIFLHVFICVGVTCILLSIHILLSFSYWFLGALYILRKCLPHFLNSHSTDSPPHPLYGRTVLGPIPGNTELVCLIESRQEANKHDCELSARGEKWFGEQYIKQEEVQEVPVVTNQT